MQLVHVVLQIPGCVCNAKARTLDARTVYAWTLWIFLGTTAAMYSYLTNDFYDIVPAFDTCDADDMLCKRITFAERATQAFALYHVVIAAVAIVTVGNASARRSADACGMLIPKLVLLFVAILLAFEESQSVAVAYSRFVSPVGAVVFAIVHGPAIFSIATRMVSALERHMEDSERYNVGSGDNDGDAVCACSSGMFAAAMAACVSTYLLLFAMCIYLYVCYTMPSGCAATTAINAVATTIGILACIPLLLSALSQRFREARPNVGPLHSAAMSVVSVFFLFWAIVGEPRTWFAACVSRRDMAFDTTAAAARIIVIVIGTGLFILATAETLLWSRRKPVKEKTDTLNLASSSSSSDDDDDDEDYGARSLISTIWYHLRCASAAMYACKLIVDWHILKTITSTVQHALLEESSSSSVSADSYASQMLHTHIDYSITTTTAVVTPGAVVVSLKFMLAAIPVFFYGIYMCVPLVCPDRDYT
jgi:hypothetical protein